MSGIYIASKVRHAERWRTLRDVLGFPIVSTWIDEAGEGQSRDLNDLWERCIQEASSADVLVIYRQADEILKGAWIELGAALANHVPIYAVGLQEFTIAHYKGIDHFSNLDHALILANQFSKDRRTITSQLFGEKHL